MRQPAVDEIILQHDQVAKLILKDQWSSNWKNLIIGAGFKLNVAIEPTSVAKAHWTDLGLDKVEDFGCEFTAKLNFDSPVHNHSIFEEFVH